MAENTEFYLKQFEDLERDYPKELCWLNENLKRLVELGNQLRQFFEKGIDGVINRHQIYSYLSFLKHNLFNINNDSKYTSYQSYNLNIMYPAYDFVEKEIAEIKKTLTIIQNNEKLKKIYLRIVKIFSDIKNTEDYKKLLVYIIHRKLNYYPYDYRSDMDKYSNYSNKNTLDWLEKLSIQYPINGQTLFQNLEINTEEDKKKLYRFLSTPYLLIIDLFAMEINITEAFVNLDVIIKFANKEISAKSYKTIPIAPFGMDPKVEENMRNSVEDSLNKMKTSALKIKQKINNLLKHDLIADYMIHFTNYRYNEKIGE